MKQTRKTPSYIFLDLAQMVNGAASTLGNLRSEIDGLGQGVQIGRPLPQGLFRVRISMLLSAV